MKKIKKSKNKKDMAVLGQATKLTLGPPAQLYEGSKKAHPQ